MVPAGAGVQGLLLSSPSLRARHDLSEAEFTKGVPVARNARAAGCKGGRRALPLQGAEVEDAVHLRWNACSMYSLAYVRHLHVTTVFFPVTTALKPWVGRLAYSSRDGLALCFAYSGRDYSDAAGAREARWKRDRLA